MNKTSKYNFISLILPLVIFFTNLSQIPNFVDSLFFKLMSYIPWVIMFLVVLYTNNFKFIINNKKNILLLVIGIILICFLIEIIGLEGFRVSLLKPILICFFVYTIGFNCCTQLKDDKIQYICLAYALSAVIICFFVFQKIVQSGVVLNSSVYAYESKNSVSQILLTGFLIFVFYRKKINIFTLFFDIASIFLLFTMIMLKSRASLLGIGVIVISVLLSDKYKRNTKKLVTLLCVFFICLFLFNKNLQNFIINDIIFASRDTANLDAISSGRLSMIQNFPSLFLEQPFLGHGSNYIEIMQLDAVLETGIFGGVLINILALLPLIYSIKSIKKYNTDYNFVLLILSVIYYINSFFEQLSPFGPGVKCYFLWLVYGLCIGWNERVKIN